MHNELSSQIERDIQKRPMYKDALSVYKDLIAFSNKIEPEINYEINDDVIHDIKVKEGFPLFSREKIPVDLTSTITLFSRFLEHLSSKKRKDKEALEKTLKKLETDSDWFNNVINSFLSRDETMFAMKAEEVNLDPMVLKFLTHMSLRPSLNILKESVSERIKNDTWGFCYCPLCGSQPNMAHLDDQGKRFLHCEFCGSIWNYPRLKCPFCENNEAKTLGYFVSEEEEGFRVDFCKKCSSYIKTADMRIIEYPLSLELENLLTLHLDMLAHEQGFKAHVT